MGLCSSKQPVATTPAGETGTRQKYNEGKRGSLSGINAPNFEAPYLQATEEAPAAVTPAVVWKPDPHGTGCVARQLARQLAKRSPPYDDDDVFGVPLLAGAYRVPRECVFTHLLNDDGARGRRVQDRLFVGRGDREALLRAQLALTEVLQFASAYKRGEPGDAAPVSVSSRHMTLVDGETGSISAASVAASEASAGPEIVIIREMARKHAVLRNLMAEHLRGSAFDEGDSRTLRSPASASVSTGVVMEDGSPNPTMLDTMASVDSPVTPSSNGRLVAWLPVYILCALCDIAILQELCYVALVAAPSRPGWLKWRTRLVDAARTYAKHIRNVVPVLRQLDTKARKDAEPAVKVMGGPDAGGGRVVTPPGAREGDLGTRDMVAWGDVLRSDPEFLSELGADAASIASALLVIREEADKGDLEVKPHMMHLSEPVVTGTTFEAAAISAPFTLKNDTLVAVAVRIQREAWTNAELGLVRPPGSLNDMRKCVDAFEKYYPSRPDAGPCHYTPSVVQLRVTGDAATRVPGGVWDADQVVTMEPGEVFSCVVAISYPTDEAVLKDCTKPATFLGGNIVFSRPNKDSITHVSFSVELGPADGSSVPEPRDVTSEHANVGNKGVRSKRSSLNSDARREMLATVAEPASGAGDE